jgi:hypothetical protein
MNQETDAILSEEQVISILQRGWSFSTSTNRSKNVTELKLSDWDVLAEDIKIMFSKADYIQYKIPTFSGEAYSKLLGKHLNKKSRSLFTIILFILINEDLISDEDKSLFDNFTNVRNHFLQKYLSTVAESDTDLAKSDLSKVTKANTSSKNISTHLFQNNFFSIFLLAIVSIFGIYALNSNWLSGKNDDLTHSQDSNINLKITSLNKKGQIPCDIKFEYDLTNVDFKNGYLSFLDQKIPIKSKKGNYIQTFTSPILTDVSMVLDNMIKKQQLQINSSDWMTSVNNLPLPTSINEGVLQLPLDNIPASILSTGQFYVNHSNIQDFNVNGDEMIFEAKVKNPTTDGGISCNDISFNIHGYQNGKHGILSFNFLIPGCQRYAKIKAADTHLPSEQEKLLMNSGINTEAWVDVKAVTTKNVLTIFADGKMLHEIPYIGKIGKVNFLLIGFKGTGSVDMVKLQDLSGENTYFEEFERK